MLTLYFSGTGNSAFVAHRLADGLGGACHSIEEELAFAELIQQTDTVAFVYPIYASRPPRILREFVSRHLDVLHGKQLIILCTQMGFSGDGARSLTDVLPKGSYTVRYAEHIMMPNNINNLAIFPQTGEKRMRSLPRKAQQVVDRICRDVAAGTVRKRGFRIGSRLLGLVQAWAVPAMDRMMRNGVHISGSCIGCGLCAKRCPMHNLAMEGGKAVPLGNCTTCYRCANLCPANAISLYTKKAGKWQYRGIDRTP